MYDSEKQSYLNNSWDNSKKRIIMLLLIKLSCFICYLVFIAKILNLYHVKSRLHNNHLNTVLLCPYADWKKNDL